LEPEWEARFEIRSYGFRPGRGCHDAIEVIFNTLRGRNARRLWILDADLTAAFDRIDHSQLVAALGSFPGRDAIGHGSRPGCSNRERGSLRQRRGPRRVESSAPPC
jgi:RNA-directed DNA polymerase